MNLPTVHHTLFCLSATSAAVFCLWFLQPDQQERAVPEPQAPGQKARPQVAGAQGLRLALEPVSGHKPLHLSARQSVRVFLENHNREPVTLIMPGDGSDLTNRSPIISWSITALPSQRTYPQALRCGGYYGVRSTDIFVLAPGKRRQLQFRGFMEAPPLYSPGHYRIQYHYRNAPQMKWGNDAEIPQSLMARIRNTTACNLTSNVLEVTVLP